MLEILTLVKSVRSSKWNDVLAEDSYEDYLQSNLKSRFGCQILNQIF